MSARLNRPSACFSNFGLMKRTQRAAAERHIVPVVDRKVEDRQARGRQIVLKRFFAAASPLPASVERQFMHAGIMADQHQSFGIGGFRHADDLQQLRRVGAVEFGRAIRPAAVQRRSSA